MGPDVRHLLRFLRVPGFRYRDWGWPELQWRSGAPPRRAFTTIAVVSLLPGVGRTTLCANLAARLAQRGLRSAAFDLDPRGTLGAQLAKRPGIALERPDDPGPARLVRWVAENVGFVPSGNDPALAMELLAAECDVAVLDVPAGISLTLQQALSEADELVVVLRADPESVQAVRPTEALLARHRMKSWRRTGARYVVNRFDARRRTDRESLAALRELLGPRLLHPPIQEDRAVGDALRLGRFIDEQAPASQVVGDIAEIARQVIRADRALQRSDRRRSRPVRRSKVRAKNARVP
jgi:cellulose biosynthesis protein BcsQ